jgi:hypothetical protein
MFDLMQYALIFYDFQLILARMPSLGGGGNVCGTGQKHTRETRQSRHSGRLD